MIYSLFRNAEHAAAKATDRTDFVSIYYPTRFFFFFNTHRLQSNRHKRDVSDCY